MSRELPTKSRGSGVRHKHVSLRFNANYEGEAAYVAEEAQGHNVLTCTEVYSARLVELIRDALGPDWKVYHRGEYLYGLLSREVSKQGRLTVRRMTRVWSGADAWRDLWVARMPVKTSSSGRTVVRVVHNASGVEQGADYARAREGTETWRKVRVNSRGIRRVGRRIRLDLLVPGTKCSLAGDLNTNQRDPRWRRRTARAVGLPSAWALRDVGGTHPNDRPHRGIDTIHAKGITRFYRGDEPPEDVDHWSIGAHY